MLALVESIDENNFFKKLTFGSLITVKYKRLRPPWVLGKTWKTVKKKY